MASRAMYQPLLARVPQDAVTQRLCAAWFSRFPLETVLHLREAPPEVFDFIIMQSVRTEVRERRKQLLVIQLAAFVMSAVTALDIATGNWVALPFTLIGWSAVVRGMLRLTPERCIPPFILRINRWRVSAEQNCEPPPRR